MNKWIRIFNQNRKNIIIGVVAIIFLIVLVQILNQLVGMQNRNNQNKINEQVENKLPTTSIITGETVDTKITQENVNTIEEFINYCNQQEVRQAYDMLTNDCKEELFPTEQEFVKGYYNLIFSEKRRYRLDNYKNSSTSYTYEVTFYTDILSTGQLSQTNSYTDYISLNKNANGKININSFINRIEMEKENERDGIKVKVLGKTIYKDYESYEIEVENNTDKTILLDTRQKNKTIYAIGSDNATYTALRNEIPSSWFELDANHSRTYTIKFNKRYNPLVRIKAIVFTDIIEDYEQYKLNPDKSNRVKIQVEF
ncbi:MAG: hypothetical protein ACLU84_04375 [Clostridia bacterium]